MIPRSCKFLFLLLLIAGFSMNLSGQNKMVDSLNNELKNGKLSDSARMETLLRLGWNYALINTDSARLFLDKAIYYSKILKDINKTGEAYNYIGTDFLRSSDYDSAMHYYSIADSLYKLSNNELSKINFSVNKMAMATVMSEQGNQLQAIKYYLEGIDSIGKYNFHDKWNILVSAYTNIGNVYNEIEQFDKMLEYDLKALTICNSQKIADSKTVQVQMLTALAYVKLKDYNNAEKLFQKIDPLSEKIYSPYIFSIQYGIIGKYYKDQNKQDSAVNYYKKSLLYSQQSNNKFQEANMLQELGIIFSQNKKYRESIDYLEQSLNLSKKIGDKKREVNSLKYLSELYSSINQNAKAVRTYEAYIRLKDSLDKSANLKKINEIENKYQAKQKADSILVLRKNTQLQELALHKKQNQNIFTIIGASLLLLTGFLLYRNLRSKHRLLKKTEQLHEQQITQLEQEHQLIAAQSIMKGQEEERSRLAKDLHDGVGGLLSGVKLSLSNMKGNVFLSEGNANAVTTIIEQLDSSINELRRVSHNMMPEALIKYGLKEALENYCESIDQSGALEVRLQTYGLENRMPQDTEIILYRIVQELLNNVIKHAEARQVLIQLMRESDRFTLTVEDDGKGFDRNSKGFQSGAGLENIHARVGYLNGVLDINTKPGEGTSVTIEGSAG